MIIYKCTEFYITTVTVICHPRQINWLNLAVNGSQYGRHMGVILVAGAGCDWREIFILSKCILSILSKCILSKNQSIKWIIFGSELTLYRIEFDKVPTRLTLYRNAFYRIWYFIELIFYRNCWSLVKNICWRL